MPAHSSDMLPPPLRRVFAAVVFDWGATAGIYRHTNASVLRALVEQSCQAGMDLAVLAEGPYAHHELRALPHGPGRLLFCLDGGGHRTDRGVFEAGDDGLALVHRGLGADTPLQWLFGELWSHGIDAGAVAWVGAEAAAPAAGMFGAVTAAYGGPKLLRLMLADQLRRRHDAEIDIADPTADWGITLDNHDPSLTRVRESLLTLADGRLGTRGSPVVGDDAGTPAVFYAGAYEGDGAQTELAQLPLWSEVSPAGSVRRPSRSVVDLHSAILREDGPTASLRFSSLARPGTVVLRARGESIGNAPEGKRQVEGVVHAVMIDQKRGAALERFGSYDPDPAVAEAAVASAQAAGFDQLLREHREAWARRWRVADIVIDGDPELQRGIRLALFHLMGSVADRGEAAVGARGLSGPAYRGHVFWDSDVFVLPFLAATHPPAARAMLEYRWRRLPAACAAAQRLGRAGARFPWESAADGTDVTPSVAHLPTGDVVRVHTGDLEEHIVTCVAWAAACYDGWTADADFTAAGGAGHDLIAQTARYWAARVRIDGDDQAHIDDVVGPDEYHPGVDDNAFTNVMARWNLRRAAALPDIAASERAAWLAVADALVDGYDARSRLYEQFAGFFNLRPMVIAEISPRRPVAADLLLGVDRTARTQVVKQPDVLMLHHLVPDEVGPDSLAANLDFYEPRTAHGSSLSPAIHASLLARAGRMEPALAWLRVAARIDLDDLTGTTAGGLHLATMGGLWQALTYGFAGVRIRSGRLRVEPHLPPGWRSLEIGLRFRDHPLRLRLGHSTVEIDSDAFALSRRGEHWEVTPP